MKSRYIKEFTFVAALAASFGAFANQKIKSELVPEKSFFVGLGAAYSSTEVEQDVYGFGTADFYSSGVKVGSGYAGGPSPQFKDSTSKFAPNISIGYFDHFKDSNYIFGSKLFYQYQNASVSHGSTLLPQYGVSTTTGGESSTLQGNAEFGNMQTTLTHVIGFVPFIGKSFDNSYIYLGAGPTYNKITSDLIMELDLQL